MIRKMREKEKEGKKSEGEKGKEQRRNKKQE